MELLCMKCNNVYKDNCNCGCKSYIIYRKGLRFEDGRLICFCGNDQFDMFFHMQCNPYHIKGYKCENKHTISVYSYI